MSRASNRVPAHRVTSDPVNTNRPPRRRNNLDGLTIIGIDVQMGGRVSITPPKGVQTLSNTMEETGVAAGAYWRQIGADGRSTGVVRFCLRSCAVFFALLISAGAGVSQPTSQPTPLNSEEIQARVTASEQIRARIVEVARNLKDNRRLKNLTQEDREKAVQFVVGNMLFVLLHELAHAAIADLELPVLGREEEAADEVAIVRMLWVGSAFTRSVLADATKGLVFSGRRDRKEGGPLAFYDEHSLDQQRAYQIVCLMVGHDPNAMADLANEMKLPDERRERCEKDFV